MGNTRAARSKDSPATKGKPKGSGEARSKAIKPKPVNRHANGTSFKPGNPGGGRPKVPDEIKQATRELSLEAIKTLAAVMRGAKTRPAEKIRAAEVILNRAWGTPTQSVELTGKDGGPLETASLAPAERAARIAEILAKAGV